MMTKSLAFGILVAAMAVAGPWCAAQRELPRLENVGPPEVSSGGLDKLPLAPQFRAELAKSLDAHDYGRAQSILMGAIEKNPASPQLLTFAGGVFFLGGSYLNAAIAMKKAEALAPLDESSRFTLAMAYVTLNHRDWARPELEKLAASDPKNALYPYWLSRLDYDLMHFEGAIGYARKAIELDPKFMKAFDELGLCYEAMGKYGQAIGAYRNAVALNKTEPRCSPWPPLDFGALLVKLGRLDEAMEVLDESLGCAPNFPRAHYQLGFLFEKEKKDEEAVRELRQAASLDPQYAEPYYLLGQIYQRQGKAQKASEAWTMFENLKKAQSQLRPH